MAQYWGESVKILGRQLFSFEMILEAVFGGYNGSHIQILCQLCLVLDLWADVFFSQSCTT